MAEDDQRDEGRVLAAHFGRSANCSSIGSYVDYLFLSAAASGAILAALSIALARKNGERVEPPPPEASTPEEPRD